MVERMRHCLYDKSFDDNENKNRSER